MSLHTLKRHTRRFCLTAMSVAVLAACNSNDPEKLMASASEAFAKREISTAAIQVKNVLQQQPDNAQARLLFGQILLAQHDPAGAANELRKARDAGASLEAYAPALAKAMSESGEGAAALTEFKDVELKDPQQQASLSSALGRALMAQNDGNAATVQFQKAIRLRPDSPDAQLGLALIHLVGKDAATAQNLVDAVLKAHPDMPDAVLLQTELLIGKGQNADAITRLQQAVAVRKDDVRLWSKLVSLQTSAGQLKEATESLASLRKLSPSHPQTFYLEGMLALRQDQFEGARDAAAKVLRIAPNHIPSLVMAASANMRLGDPLQAQTQLRQVLAAKPDWYPPRKMLAESLLATRDVDGALETLKPMLDSNTQDPDVWNLAGQAYLVKGDYERSTDYLTRVSSAKPDSAQALTRLALARMAAGDETQGMQELEAATRMDQSSVQADLAIIASHMRKGDTAKALVAVAALEKKQPDSAMTYVVKGQALLAARDFVKGRAAFVRALELAPEDISAAVQLARLDMADNKPGDARKHFDRIIEKNPKNVRAHVLLAALLGESGAPAAQVQSQLEKAVAAEPTRNEGRLALIQFLLKAGNNKQALEVAQQAQAAQPDNPEVLRLLGRTQMSAGERQQALSTFSKLQAMQPQSPLALVELADAQRANGDSSGAEQSLRRALELKADFPDAQQRLVVLLVANKKTDEALKISRSMQAAQPKQGAGYILEGQILADAGRWPEAATALQKAYQQAKSPQVVTILHTALLQQKKAADAQRLLDDWFRAQPKDVIVRTYLGERALKEKRYAEAVTQYKAVQSLQPGAALVLNNLAWAANQVNDAKTLEYAEAALKAAPQAPEVMETVGSILVERGQAERGLGLLREAVKQAPQAAVIRLGLAKALARTGDKAGAKDAARLAKESAPADSDIAREIDGFAKTLNP